MNQNETFENLNFQEKVILLLQVNSGDINSIKSRNRNQYEIKSKCLEYLSHRREIENVFEEPPIGVLATIVHAAFFQQQF